MSDEKLTVTMEQVSGLEFRVRFDWDTAAELVLDEPEPIGNRRGPNATRLVAAAVGNCLTASLAFCLQRARVPSEGLRTTVTGQMVRNENKRLRIGGFEVRIELPEDLDPASATRCLGLFEEFCIVTASVRQGIPVSVEVVDANGETVHTG